jgi:heat shock protein HspQ
MSLLFREVQENSFNSYKINSKVGVGQQWRKSFFHQEGVVLCIFLINTICPK